MYAFYANCDPVEAGLINKVDEVFESDKSLFVENILRGKRKYTLF